MKIEIVQPVAPPEVTPPLVSPRGAKLAIRIWKPAKSSPPPRALVVFVHGGGGHSGYFNNIAQGLVEQQHALVVAYDQPGCGYSEKEPNAPGSEFGIVHFDSFDDLVSEIFNVVDYSKKYLLDGETAKTIPVFLVGESFGGIQVVNAIMDAPKGKYGQDNAKISGAILMGGVFRIHKEFLPPTFVIKILGALSTVLPRVLMPATDFSITFDEAFGSKEWATVCRHDPKFSVNPRPTIFMITEILTRGPILLRGAKDVQIPILGVHGAKDCRCDPQAVKEFCDNVPNGMAEYYPVMNTTGHQLLQDQPEITLQVIEKVSSWIGSQLTK